jgi:putative (di)nucleoside polyphosphate hydrolase
VIDTDGFRPNVGIILCNDDQQLFWAKRVGQNAWQFPQGGIRRHESLKQALYRELWEETGLQPEHVEIIGVTRHWLRYRLPKQFIRNHSHPLCIGQKQRWFLLRLLTDENALCLDASHTPEFDGWRWVDYWDPVEEVVFFKRKVYQRALGELAPLLFPEGAPPRQNNSSLKC